MWGGEGRTQVRVFFILVPSGPEEWTDDTCAFDAAVWEVHGCDHGLVDFRAETDDMRGEGFGVLGILLETGTISIFPFAQTSLY